MGFGAAVWEGVGGVRLAMKGGQIGCRVPDKILAWSTLVALTCYTQSRHKNTLDFKGALDRVP